ncbi:hypothetical protein FS749_013299 [Ceratobasidium sp. UAMH 11750]|nr:hypothetical protein FS749_013299 [Ceratobasidium sp. UAMH 11750]
MSRFHFYAPYIKVLQVCGIGANTWELLAAYSNDNVLLPNLVELRCDEFEPEAFSVFLLPSTQRLTIDKPPKELARWNRLDMVNTKRLLEHAASRCPSLRSLEFYPEPIHIIDVPTPIQTFALLSNFKDLRRLVSTPVVIQSTALQLVAQLPCLTSLSIGPTEKSGHWDSSLCEPVPAGGFPALCDLTLCLENPQDVRRFWELIPLGMLKKLDLTIPEVTGDEPPFIPTLCQASPQITKLRVMLPEFERFHWEFYEISADTFEHLACLALESVSFEGIKLDFEDAWVKVVGAWPNLKSAELLGPRTNLEDLLFLSSNLPKLESIGCKLNLNYATVETNWSPVGRPLVYPHLRHLTLYNVDLGDTMGYESVGGARCKSRFGHLARFLAYYWPKLSIQVVKEPEEERDSYYHREYYEKCGHHLAAQDVSVGLFKELVETYVEWYHPA